MNIHVSPGNLKMGPIPSVSFPSGITCNPQSPCFKECYAHRLELFRKTVRDSYADNLRIYNENPIQFFRELSVVMKLSSVLRINVSGDIPDYKYFVTLAQVTSENPNCHVLIFTKQGKFIAHYLEMRHTIPENMHIRLSNWYDGWKCYNPYDLPTATVFNKNEEPPEDSYLCPGKCILCFMTKGGCFNSKNNDIAIRKH